MTPGNNNPAHVTQTASACAKEGKNIVDSSGLRCHDEPGLWS
jgi:hypothetical protein